MIIIPSRESKKLVQTNRSSILGNLYNSFNLDLNSNIGAIRISPRTLLNTSSFSDANLGCPVAFRYFDTAFWAICGSKIFSNNGTVIANFAADSSTGNQTDYSADESDMEIFNGTLCATTTDGLFSKASNGSGGGAWTQRDTLNTATPHILCYYKKFDRLYYSDLSDNIISINSSWSTADPGSPYAISLSSTSDAYFITSMKASSSRIIIGTINNSNLTGVGKILEWDGLSSQITNEYKLNAQGCLAIAIDPVTDYIYAMDSNGVLLKFNGGGFSEVGRLPISNKLLSKMADPDNERFIHPNGLQVTREGKILAFVNNLNLDGTINEAFNAGIYEFDGAGSCIHKQSISYYGTSVTDYGQNRLSRVGALYPANIYDTLASRNGTYFFGATYYTNATTTRSGIFYDDSNDTLQKYGYLVTNWIFSENIQDDWQKILIKYRKMLDSSDKIVIKYRLTESEPSSDITITWYNDEDKFVTSADISAWSVGDEVEIVQGNGSGKCAHITAIDDLGGSVTKVTLDETFEGVTNTDTAKIRIQKWIKLSSISNQIKESDNLILGKISERIQFKICCQFTGKDELFELGIINKTHQFAL